MDGSSLRLIVTMKAVIWIAYKHEDKDDVQAHTCIIPLAATNSPRIHRNKLVHLSDKFVDIVLPVTKVTTQNVVLKLARSPTAGGVGQLEGPQEVGCLGITVSVKSRIIRGGYHHTCLKLGPTVKISCTRSSIERMSYLPSASSMTWLFDNAVRCLASLPYPRL